MSRSLCVNNDHIDKVKIALTHKMAIPSNQTGNSFPGRLWVLRSPAKPLHIASITGWFNADVETFHETSLQCVLPK